MDINPMANIPSSHSLSADIAMGWRPKLKIIGPVPLNFDNQVIDPYIDSLLSTNVSLFSVAYLGKCQVTKIGPRPANTFIMQDMLARNYKYKYQHLLCTNYPHLKAFFHKFYQEFQCKCKRSFVGMNPSAKDHNLLFDSLFQSGNLDCAVKVKQNQYDLVLRIDANTRGHIQWFNFKVSNTYDILQSRTVRFNIVNLRKNKTSYERGMRPYIRRNNGQWSQSGQNISISRAAIRFGKGNLNSQGNPTIDGNCQTPVFKKLSFDLTFEPGDHIEVAYSIPYTYSMLINYLRDIKQVKSSTKDLIFEVDYTSQSLSGLEIPVLKITEDNQSAKERKKYAICIIGRQHPGQANSSYVVQGLISALLNDSEQMRTLRQRCEFYIVPMVNPDGVVMGNFRTSLYGRDLNRLYKRESFEMIPEIENIKKMMHNVSQNFKQKLLLFVDLHGHSVRKNSFAYGPSAFGARSVVDVRMLPKKIANCSDIFRYQSCSFRMQQSKKATARGVFSRYAELCYTIETSNWSYNLPNIEHSIAFQAATLAQVGCGIGHGIGEYIKVKFDERMRNIERRKKNKETEPIILENRLSRVHSIRKVKFRTKTQSNFQKVEQRYNLLEKRMIIHGKQQKSYDGQQKIQKWHQQQHRVHYQEQPKQEAIKKIQGVDIQEQSPKKDTNLRQIVEASESDRWSDNGYDSQSSEEDMEQEKFRQYFNVASKMVIEFEKAYYGNEYDRKQKSIIKMPPPPITTKKILKKNVDAMACLKKNYQKQMTLSKDSSLRRQIRDALKCELSIRPLSRQRISIKYGSAIRRQLVKEQGPIFPKIISNSEAINERGNPKSMKTHYKGAQMKSLSSSQLRRVE